MQTALSHENSFFTLGVLWPYTVW